MVKGGPSVGTQDDTAAQLGLDRSNVAGGVVGDLANDVGSFSRHVRILVERAVHVHGPAVQAAADVDVGGLLQGNGGDVGHQLFVDDQALLVADLGAIGAVDVAGDEVRGLRLVVGAPSSASLREGAGQSSGQLEVEGERVLSWHAVVLEGVHRDAHIEEPTGRCGRKTKPAQKQVVRLWGGEAARHGAPAEAAAEGDRAGGLTGCGRGGR